MENKKVKNNSSEILKDAMALFLITLISGLALSFIYEITKGPIKVRGEADQVTAYQAVYYDAASFKKDDKLMAKAKGSDISGLNKAYKGITIDEINQAYDADNKMIGYVYKVSTAQGYKDVITLAVGYTKEGVVTGIETLSINETAGLGMNAKNPEFKKQFANKKVDVFVVTKTGATKDNQMNAISGASITSGATKDNQINAISGATITSRAVTNAVNAGMEFIKKYSGELGGKADE